MILPHGKDRRGAGFTLLEILLVIVVIAILVAILVKAATAIKTMAKKQQSIATARSIEQAFLSYRYDYDRWPGQPYKTADATNAFAKVWSNDNVLAIAYLLPGHGDNLRNKDYWAQSNTVLDAFGTVFTISITNDGVKVTSPNF